LVGHVPYFDELFHIGFNVGGFELGLLPDGEGVATRWGVDNIESEGPRTLSMGSTLKDAVKDAGGGIKVAVVTAPFGNDIGLIENPHFKVGERPLGRPGRRPGTSEYTFEKTLPSDAGSGPAQQHDDAVS